MISLKQLHYALAVNQTRHFKKAAEQCHVSQSTLSSAIAELESQLDLQIFERDNKKVLVTPVGEQLLHRAMIIMTEVDDLQQLANSFKQPLSHPMSLGVIPTIGPYFLPKVMPSVREQYPDLKLSIVEEQSHVLVDMVRRGDLDCAVLALPYPHEGLLSFEFWQEDFYSVVHHSDPHASLECITSQELEDSNLLLLREGHCLTDHALEACHMDKRAKSSAMSGTSLYTLVQMVAGRLGTTLIPAMGKDQLLAGNPDIRAIPLSEPGPHRRIAVLCRPNFTGVSGIQALIKIFKQSLSD